VSGDVCAVPPYMQAEAASERAHYHPKVRVLIYQRNSGLTTGVHYPLQFLRPEANLGIEKTALEEPSGPVVAEIYRDIHVHERSKTLHVEQNAARPYQLCDLIELWSSASPAFRTIWKNSGAVGGAHVWIDGYHIPYIRLDRLLQIPLEHDLSITICIEESVPT